MRRWTAWSEDWQEEVGCVGVETADGMLAFDPLDPPFEPDHTFVTVFFHARSARGRVWAPTALVRRLKNRRPAGSCPIPFPASPAGFVSDGWSASRRSRSRRSPLRARRNA